MLTKLLWLTAVKTEDKTLLYYLPYLGIILKLLFNLMLVTLCLLIITTLRRKKFPPGVKPKGSVPCSQDPATGPYAQPNESSPHLPSLFP